MAKMSPAHLEPGVPTSERKVYEKLRDGLPNEWFVLHSRRVVSPAEQDLAKAYEGEVDFIVLHPRWGLLGLEVKGGRISRGPGGFASMDRHGHVHDIGDPGRQVQRATHSIVKYLREHPRSRRAAAGLFFGWAVVFPDIDAPGDLGPDLPRPMVIDQRDLQAPEEALDRACRAFAKDGAPVSREHRAAVLAGLTPQLQLVSSLASRIEEDDPILLRLTEEQSQILDFLAEVPRIGVKGAAGTGKTLIATEKARRLADAGQRVLFLCYNKPLADYLSQSAEGYTVKTFHGLCRELALSAGLGFSPPRESKAQQEFWESRCGFRKF